MKDEKLFPISINSALCVRCERCMYSCPTKAIFFKNSLRFVNYNKCKGCLRCVEACEHGAIEVISIQKGQLNGFDIDHSKCTLCKLCLSSKICFQNLFNEIIDYKGRKTIVFQSNVQDYCHKCLNCFINCPSNAIIPIID